MQDIKLIDFEGPLDLLLYLIKQNDLDINNIQIELITEQYLAYIKSMESLNLDIASEYLTMATELILIKSVSLLPNEEIIIEDEEIPDLKDLKRRLTEYETYKIAANSLKDNELERKKYLSKLPSILNEYTDGKVSFTDTEGDLSSLTEAFQNMLERLKEREPLTTQITTRDLTIKDRHAAIKDKLLTQGRVKFTDLFEICDKRYIVITFLTILEMFKKQEIIIIQNNNFSEITIEAGEKL